MRCLIALLLAAAAVAGPETPADADLFRAIHNDDLTAVRSALDRGADVNAKDAQGATALMRAALYASPACLNLLLDRGADPNRPNTFGATALMWAAADIDKVRLLLSHQADVNARAKSGRTPLIVASSAHGNIEAVRLLINADADVKARDDAGTGPVWAASAAGDATILGELLAHGADPNEQDSRLGQTALMNAAGFGSSQAVRVLLNAGADVNRRSKEPGQIKAGLQDRGQMTALLWAAPFANTEMLQLLLSKHADGSVREFRGMNALQLAVTSETQNDDAVRLLLETTADVNGKDKSGQTLLDWAQKWGDTTIVRILRQAGAQASAAPAAPAPVPTRGGANIRQAVEKSVALLQASSTQFFRASGCAACHHQMLGGMLIGLARAKGVAVNEELASAQLKEVLAERTPYRELFLQRQTRGGFPMRESLVLVSLAAQKYAADSLTDAIVHNLMGAQWADGSWHGFDQRPPLEYSAFSETVYAMRAIQLYAPPGRQDEMQRRVRLAANWLSSTRAANTEEEVMQLLGLAWAEADAKQVRELASRLLAEQHPDGGWAQRQGLSSDAYATGQVLYALHEAARVPTSHDAWRRGVRYLLETQHDDGSWYVRSRSVKFQPYFESGFPYSHDQWISAAGTSWAAMALALAVEPHKRLARR